MLTGGLLASSNLLERMREFYESIRTCVRPFTNCTWPGATGRDQSAVPDQPPYRASDHPPARRPASRECGKTKSASTGAAAAVVPAMRSWIQRVHEKLVEEEGLQISYPLDASGARDGTGKPPSTRCQHVPDEPVGRCSTTRRFTKCCWRASGRGSSPACCTCVTRSGGT